MWADAQYWLGWLKNEMELNIFNAQRASDWFNTAILNDTINDVMAVASRSGGLQPGGRVNAGCAQPDQKHLQIARTSDGILPTGWLKWVEQPAARSDLDRENRIGRLS